MPKVSCKGGIFMPLITLSLSEAAAAAMRRVPRGARSRMMEQLILRQVGGEDIPRIMEKIRGQELRLLLENLKSEGWSLKVHACAPSQLKGCPTCTILPPSEGGEK